MDIDYLLWLQGIRETLGGTGLLAAVTSAAMPVAIGVALVLYWFRDKRLGLWSLMSFALGSAVLQLVKATCCVARPWVRDLRVAPPADVRAGATGYSFPSGHTQTAASAVGAAGWGGRRRGAWVPVASAAFVLLVAFSRNYLGVHTPQDVLAGMAVGALSVWLAGRAIAAVESGAVSDAAAASAMLCVSLAGMAYVLLKPYPTGPDAAEAAECAAQMVADASQGLGALAGCGLGWLLERRLVRFSCDCPRSEKLARVVAALCCVALIFLVALPLVRLAAGGKNFAYEWVEGFLAMLAGVWGAPAAARAACAGHAGTGPR